METAIKDIKFEKTDAPNYYNLTLFYEDIPYTTTFCIESIKSILFDIDMFETVFIEAMRHNNIGNVSCDMSIEKTNSKSISIQISLTKKEKPFKDYSEVWKFELKEKNMDAYDKCLLKIDGLRKETNQMIVRPHHEIVEFKKYPHDFKNDGNNDYFSIEIFNISGKLNIKSFPMWLNSKYTDSVIQTNFNAWISCFQQTSIIADGKINHFDITPFKTLTNYKANCTQYLELRKYIKEQLIDGDKYMHIAAQPSAIYFVESVMLDKNRKIIAVIDTRRPSNKRQFDIKTLNELKSLSNFKILDRDFEGNYLIEML